ncbi:MAG: COX15/CtaA family protein [Rhodoglobus sp.]
MNRVFQRFIGLFPSQLDRRVKTVAWLSLLFQLVLIGTGGAVRLTASGLGCPTWPQCTDDSLINTPEMGVHGVIEFANRLLTFVLAAITIAAFFSIFRFRRQRRDLFTLTLLQGLSIPFQAVLGGITVLTGLNPYLVGAHFAVSIILVVITTILVWRTHRSVNNHSPSVPDWVTALSWSTAAAVCLTVVLGILTTGSGPHSGDNSHPEKPAPRNGFDPAVLQHIHSWPAYLAFTLSLILMVAIMRLSVERRWIVWLLATEIAQICVGITQAQLGLPEILVGIHMVLAGILVAAMTATILALPAGIRLKQHRKSANSSLSDA